MKKIYFGIKENVKWKMIIALFAIQMCLLQFMYRFTFPVIEEGLGEWKVFDMMRTGYTIRLYVSGDNGNKYSFSSN